MKKSIKFNLTIIAIFTLSACSSILNSEEPIKVGNSAPDFSLQSSEGTEVKLSDYSGKVLLMFFFGNGWSSCRAVAPDIESKLVIPYIDNSDYAVLGLDQWDGNTASVVSFKNATKVSFPLLVGASGVAADYKTTYDRLVLVDKEGFIAFTGTRVAESDIQAVKNKLDDLLAEWSCNLLWIIFKK